MAKITFPGLADYELMISRLSKGADDIAGKAIYAGAKIVTDQIAKNIRALPIVKGFGSESKPLPGGVTMDQKKGLLETQNQQQLKQLQEIHIIRCQENAKVKKLYKSGWELNKDDWSLALPEIEKIYEHTISRLKEAFPKMSEVELSICILSLMKIKSKQMASLLDLQPSTITSYKRDIKKKYFAKVGKRHFEECLMPYLG